MKKRFIIMSAGVSILMSFPTTVIAHPWTTRNILDLEVLPVSGDSTPYTFAATGAVAVTRPRGAGSLASRAFEAYRLENLRSDVWVRMPGGVLQNITHGDTDNSGWWAPTWSPDGSQLALLSTRGDAVGLWLWDSRVRALRRISERPPGAPSLSSPPFVWLNNENILYAGAVAPATTAFQRTISAANAGWTEALDGRTPSTSVLQSGLQDRATLTDEAARATAPAVSLYRISTDGRETSLGDRIREDWRSPNWSASDHYVAWFNSPDEGPFQLRVAGLDGRDIELSGDRLEAKRIHDAAWSQTGDEFALIASGGADGMSLYRVDARSGAMRRGLTDQRLGQKLYWSSRGVVVELSTTPTRRDWYLITRDGERSNLTSGLPSQPYPYLAAVGASSFFAIAGDDLWLLRTDGSEPENLTADFAPGIMDMQHPAGATPFLAWPRLTDASSLVIRTEGPDGRAYYSADTDGHLVRLTLPEGAIDTSMAYSVATQQLVVPVATDSGLALWQLDLESGALNATPLFRANEFLEEVDRPIAKMVDYVNAAGDQLQAGVVLPPDYVPGRKYPTIVVVYPTFLYGRSSFDHLTEPFDRWNPSLMAASHDFEEAVSLNAPPYSQFTQLAASRGYVVVHPSIPVRDVPYEELMGSVMPAVDAATAEGYVDTGRLFVQGASNGGFGAIALLSLTDRFRAGAAHVPAAVNLISSYGILQGDERYGDYPHVVRRSRVEMLGGQGRMHVPPWENPERYMRGSVIFHADKIHAPLLLTQGDMDFLGMGQSEEIFLALTDLGRRAEYVRYWGEGHRFASPANIVDLYARTLAWFDDFGDISRNDPGELLWWDGNVMSRGEAPPRSPEWMTALLAGDLDPPGR
jgi:dipeptidyl aminopeptidase/acylaminoacyl peptidase